MTVDRQAVKTKEKVRMCIYNVISVLDSNMDIYQYIWRVTSPSLCLSYIYTDTQGHRYVWMTPCIIYYRGT